MKAIPTALIVLLLSTASMAVADEPPSFEVGWPFPDIALPSMDDGTPMSIADFRGEKVVLHVFASW